MEPTDTSEVIGAIAKAAPPLGVTAITLAGISLQDWVMFMTLIYTVLQTVFLIYTKLRAYKERRRNGR